MVSIVRGAMIVVTLVCWGMSLYKLRDLARDRGNLPLRALCLALLAITLSMTIQPFMPRIDQFLGLLDAARLISNCLSLLCATAAQAFLLYMTSDDAETRRSVRRRSVALAVTVTAMVALFAVTPPATGLAEPRVRDGEYYGEPFDAPFLYVYLAFLGWSLVQVVILAGRYARIAHRPLLRFGLRLIVAGSLWGLAYVSAKLVAVAVGILRPDWALAADALVVLTFTTSILLVLIGSTLPSWGPMVGLDRLWEWAGALRDYRRLHPLWRRIHDVLPQIALLPPATGVRGALAVARDASLRRVRITVEILDGYASLRPWMSGAVAAHAEQVARQHGLSGQQRAAVVEAAVIGAALRARRDGLPAADGTGQRPDPFPGPGTDLGAADQVTWLARVARALSTPLVRTIIKESGPRPGTTPVQPAER
ncbi:MAB_1171c family putative transporter [Micromonospora sp. NPDC051296]|uniref:MAB_1171c family putative transporter n=1 Tax=Micromonospora sp. NPDC051296 TaxID=3155046 RepID=UPI003434A7D1